MSFSHEGRALLLRKWAGEKFLQAGETAMPHVDPSYRANQTVILASEAVDRLLEQLEELNDFRTREAPIRDMAWELFKGRWIHGMNKNSCEGLIRACLNAAREFAEKTPK